ncbi:MAG: response regulator transcription factor [Ferruginibacter sp.]|nr:response regulator transcription factor [Ferruginibacter sp.]
MTKKITCMVVDDDDIDRLTTLSFLSDYPFMEVIGAFDSPVAALAAAQQQLPDVLFLDIDMPQMSGLELRKQLLHVPACIFITSYPDYAVESFEMAALDFLVKPFTAERFLKTMNRLEQFADIHHKASLLSHNLGADTIFIKDGYDQVKLQLHEIIYLEALKDYTGIITADRKYAVLSPLGNLIKEKAFGSFIRIHRSYAIQKHFIKKISSGEVMVNDIVLPVGRSFKDALKGLTVNL